MSLVNDFYLLDSRDRNHSIEGLRGLAVIMVLNVHFFAQHSSKEYYSEGHAFLHAIFRTLHGGHIGVDIFFVISGFLIWKILFTEKRDYVKYLVDRANRLMPAYMLNTLILSVPAFSLCKFIDNIFFLPQFLPAKTFYNFVSWSLGWEWLFYVVAFSGAIITRRNKTGALFVFVIFVIINSLVSYYIKPEIITVPDALRFSGFFLGCILSEYYKLLRAKFFICLGYLSLPGIMALTYILAQYFGQIYSKWLSLGLLYLAVDLMVCCLLAFLLNYNSIYRKFFELKMLRIIGQISYSFYLSHALITIPIANQICSVNSGQSMIVSYVVTFFVTIFVSSFLFFLTERQYLRYKQNILQIKST